MEQQALLSGTLKEDVDGCLVGVMDDGREMILIFPSGSHATDSGVTLPKGTNFATDTQISVGGGVMDSTVSIDQCPTTKAAFLIQDSDL
ncbi:hypothetical protein [Arthrobacter sp. EpRS71]|uniref:hypothetical protein n=1 Tax=Arthrobacter sp. EpRS71 TaxID=1743141 RepID=UPI0012E33EC7|nr:hypothetical protein [Arthrobacter sp. EpRS71]